MAKEIIAAETARYLCQHALLRDIEAAISHAVDRHHPNCRITVNQSEMREDLLGDIIFPELRQKGYKTKIMKPSGGSTMDIFIGWGS